MLCSADNSKFILTANQVVTACQAESRAADCVAQFRDLVEKLEKFVGTWSEHIHHAMITVRSRDMMFLVVAKTKARDTQLNEAITELEISVSNDESLSLLDFTTLCLPHCSEENVKQFASNVIMDILGADSKLGYVAVNQDNA